MSPVFLMNVEADFIKEALDAGLYKQAVTMYLQLLKSMTNHFVEDEHFCYFDDMYSPEYFLQWIYEGIMKYDIDQESRRLCWKMVIRKYFRVNAIRNMAIQATLKDNLGRVFYSLNEGLRI